MKGAENAQHRTRWMGAARVKCIGAAGVLTALLLACIGVLLAAAPAHASIRTVVLDETGPAPRNITIGSGDVVRFFNNGKVGHKLARLAGDWSFSAQIPPGQSATTSPFPTAGTFTYRDDFTIVAVPQRVDGSIIVPAGTPPSSSPSARPTSPPTRSPSASPRPSATPSGSASPSPAPTQSGTATLPGIGVGGLPTGTPTTTTGPRPDIATPGPTDSPTAAVPAVRYSQRGLIQGSPHRYGLPAALAVVAITGILSLLVRLLLAHPAATARRRTGSVGDPGKGEA